KKYDVVHIGDLVLWPLAIVSGIAQPKATRLITAYGLDITYTKRSGLLPFIYKIYLKLGIALTNKNLRVISISNATAELCLEAGFENISIIPLGVPAPRLLKATTRKTDEDYVLFVGR